MRSICLVIAGLASGFGATAFAADQVPPPQGWSHDGKIGAFVSSVAGYNDEASNDPSIASTNDALAYQASGEGHLLWQRGPESLEQRLILKFGRVKQEEVSWVDSTDEVQYRGVFRHILREPHFIYTGWGADTVFTGPEPEEYAFDPVVGQASAGYGQRYRGLAPVDSDQLEGRLGVRVQKKWGRLLTDVEDDVEAGPEAFARYDLTKKDFITLFVQYEAFSEFEDLAHIVHLGTGGLDIALAKFLTLRIAARMYYEHHPEEVAADSAGYDELSGRQETLLGLTYAF